MSQLDLKNKIVKQTEHINDLVNGMVVFRNSVKGSEDIVYNCTKCKTRHTPDKIIANFNLTYGNRFVFRSYKDVCLKEFMTLDPEFDKLTDMWQELNKKYIIPETIKELEKASNKNPIVRAYKVSR